MCTTPRPRSASAGAGASTGGRRDVQRLGARGHLQDGEGRDRSAGPGYGLAGILAVTTASVARGSYIEPALIRSPAVPEADRAPRPLDAKAAGQFRDLMRLVVTNGTGTALVSVAGAPVYAKTGTAEFGPNNPPAPIGKAAPETLQR
jgi:hypothetical protein